MILLSINNLDDYKKYGLQYKGVEKKAEGNTTLSGAKAFYEYYRAYNYDLKIQGLNEIEVANIISDLNTIQKNEEYAEIDLEAFDGFLHFAENYKGIDIDTATVAVTYEEFGFYGMTIPVRLVVKPETL